MLLYLFQDWSSAQFRQDAHWIRCKLAAMTPCERFPTAISGFGSSRLSRRRALSSSLDPKRHCSFSFSASSAKPWLKSITISPTLFAPRIAYRNRGDAGLDFVRQPFTMSNHVVEILPHSRRGRICLEHPRSCRCGAIVRGGLLFQEPAIRNLFKMTNIHRHISTHSGHRGPRQRSVGPLASLPERQHQDRPR